MKKLLFCLLHAVGVTKITAWWFRRRTIFLCYHGVTARAERSPEDPKGLHVNAERFAGHLDFLQRRYRIVSLRDYLKAQREGQPLPDYSLVMTFDDGFRNFLTVAAPMLAARNIPATVFLITDKAGSCAERSSSTWTPDDDSCHLSWDEARLLQQAEIFEFGSHTCSHPALLTLSPAESGHELQHSYNALVTNLGVESPTLSYPKGQYSNLLAEAAREVGYACALTTDRGANELNHDLFTLGRALIGDYDDKASFAVRVSGLRWTMVKLLGFALPWRVAPPSLQSGKIHDRPADNYSDVGKVFEVPN
ncbi:MAG: polysaccharide deacetylase family protein [Acidobacteriota bacterium]|nr:polysaccharide deacetylase family protein [Acidobacteriota bacterium]